MRKPRKSKRGKKLTKGQKWWRGLTPEQQAKWIDEKTARKGRSRVVRSRKWLLDNNLKFDCSKCIHGIINSCVDRPFLPNGCEYWENLVTDERVPVDLLPKWVDKSHLRRRR